MSRHVVVNGRELSMNDVGFIDPNSEWSVTVGEDGSVEGNRLDLKAENARLRELVRKYVEYTSQDRCEGCVCKRKCNDGDVDECWQRTEIRELARELGIEEDE